MTRLLAALVASAALMGCTQNAPPDQPSLSALTAPSGTAISVPLNFTTHLNGSNEVPPVPETRGQGQAIFQLDKSGQALSYKLIASNIENVIMAHIHMGPADGTGPVVVWLYPSTTPPPALSPGGGRHDGVLATGTIVASNFVGPLAGSPMSALLDAINGGNAYVNVHTDDGVSPPNTGPGDLFPGEIRGQL
jgi:hypothetical protein